jgi:uncharacterized protein YukE
MQPLPDLVEPDGAPAAIREMANRLRSAGAEMGSTATGMRAASEAATEAWEGAAQQAFSVLTDGMGEIVRKAGELSQTFAEALRNYAEALEQSQEAVRQARTQLQQLVMSTPPGVPLDPVTVRLISSQAQLAHGAARLAARELAAVAVQLTGGPDSTRDLPGITLTSPPSFVSQMHHSMSIDTTTTHARRRFDVQADGIRSQLLGTVGALSLASPAPGTAPRDSIVYLPVSSQPTFTNGQRAETVMITVTRDPILNATPVPSTPTTGPAAMSDAEANALLEAGIVNHVINQNTEASRERIRIDNADRLEDTTAITRGFSGRNDPAWNPWPLPAGVDAANAPLSRRP